MTTASSVTVIRKALSWSAASSARPWAVRNEQLAACMALYSSAPAAPHGPSQGTCHQRRRSIVSPQV